MLSDSALFDSVYFTTQEEGDVAVCTFLATRLTDEDNIEQLGHQLNAIVEKLGKKRVVLDVSSVAYITSSVIGKWISLHRKLDREGGKLALCGITEGLEDILGTARLLTYFNVGEDVAAARELIEPAA